MTLKCIFFITVQGRCFVCYTVLVAFHSTYFYIFQHKTLNYKAALCLTCMFCVLLVLCLFGRGTGGQSYPVVRFTVLVAIGRRLFLALCHFFCFFVEIVKELNHIRSHF